MTSTTGPLPRRTGDLPTPALVVDADALEHNLSTMAAALPGARCRPHVKAHKCTALAAEQRRHGHPGFTCATPREALGLVAAGLGADVLVANEVLDPDRLAALAAATRASDDLRITLAVDSDASIAAAAAAGIRDVLIDVNVGLPRCGCAPDDAGRLAELARARGLEVRGVMGYEGHVVGLADRDVRAEGCDASMQLLAAAHDAVGGDIVSAGATGTYAMNTTATEIQAGSYALMDSAYGKESDLPFRQALFVVATVLSVGDGFAVADAGLKAFGMDHGNPSFAPGPDGDVEGRALWFCSDEHVTFAPGVEQAAAGDRVALVPAHVDPTVAYHEWLWLVRGDEVLDRWSVDLRGW